MSASADILDCASNPIELFLQPGEVYFGERCTRIRTLLGSCVAISIWNASRCIGGLCHFMLPSRSHHGHRGHGPGDVLDGRYGDEAMLMFLRNIRAAGARPEEFEAKLFGGGRMFEASHGPNRHDVLDVSTKNVQMARTLVRRHGLKLKAEHLGGSGHRNLVFEVWSGHAYLKFWGQDAEQNQAMLQVTARSGKKES
ncbi:MAG: chemotaxis protein CheD [Proteobacteria bacterium]|nr:chemotaxis protein CheD [Pseudomonadota bacterium]